jgi:nitrite reductase/ring-hydroxylating ferredoxin subunit
VSLARVGTLRRDVRASLARVWENVLDWEHLPWLHRDTFAGVALEAAGPWGWRAAIRLRGAAAAPPLDVELRIDRARASYDTRTLGGAGAGTCIRTRLEPRGERLTRVTVTFDVPDVPSAAVRAVGDAYVALYRRLWDEDEAMMRTRQAVLDGGGEGAVRTVAVDGRPRRFRTVCPHRGGPLDAAPVEPDGCLTCPWHGYRFDLRTGRSADGRALLLEGWETG